MARLTLTPTNFPGTGGSTLPASGTSLATASPGVQFVNNGSMVLLVYVGASGAGNATQNFGRQIESETPAPVVVALSNSTNYWLGPWSPKDFTAIDGTGMTYIDFSVVTGNSVTLYQLNAVS